MADTRENLARLQDLRDEVEKQIRHLQRQANDARRYQDLKDAERNLTAELLALRLRELDSGAAVQDSAVRECELTMQQALADQRAAEAAIEKQRDFHTELTEAVSRVQGRYYELGAEVTRTEENIRYTRELRERAAHRSGAGRAPRWPIWRSRSSATSSSWRRCAPKLRRSSRRSRRVGQRAARPRSAGSGGAASWRPGSSAGKHSIASSAPPVRARRSSARASSSWRASCIAACAGRSAGVEHEALTPQHAECAARGAERARGAARARRPRRSAHELAGGAGQRAAAARGAAARPIAGWNAARSEREQAARELMSLEALQKAALREKDPRAGDLAGGRGWRSARRGWRETLEVQAGWERAVETVLGDYLEAVGVETLGAAGAALPTRWTPAASPSSSERRRRPPRLPPGTLAAKVRGPGAVRAMLAARA